MKQLGSVFVDSGAHSLYTKHVISVGHRNGFSYYETDEFWKYVDDYAEFIKKRKHLIDVYVNVDVIFNPELTWKVQRYMEDQHKLKPLPVVHFNTDLKWLKKYMETHEYIGIGGLGQEVSVKEYMNFGDPVFKMICDDEGMPQYKLHGFAITAPPLVHRYPWFSCDSTSWVQFSRFGSIIIPKIKRGKYDYTTSPIIVFVSKRSPKQKEAGKHIDTLSGFERETVLDYLAVKGFVLGESTLEKRPLDHKNIENEHNVSKEVDHKIVEVVKVKGVSNNNLMRDSFNALYYQGLSDSVPDWPWSFKQKIKKGFL